jgi:hypothetical protein
MSAVHQGWGTRQIEDARRLWRRIWLLAGGTPASIRRHCDPFRLGVCRENGGEMPCQCRHWYNIPHRKRAMLIAVRAGMPYGLIALVSGEPPQKVAAQVDLYIRLCETVPALKAQAERITALVPMWSSRVGGELSDGKTHADCL